MIELHDVEQGSPEWHALRDPLITGTSAENLLRFGAIDYTVTKQSNFKGNFWTRRGHVLEDEAIELYQEITKSVGIRMPSGRKVGFVTNSKYPQAGYSPDDYYPDHTIEVKAFDEPHHMELMRGEIPSKVLAQVHFGLFLAELPFCHLLPYNPNLSVDQAFKIITIKASPAINANFKRRLAAAKEHVHANTAQA